MADNKAVEYLEELKNSHLNGYDSIGEKKNRVELLESQLKSARFELKESKKALRDIEAALSLLTAGEE